METRDRIDTTLEQRGWEQRGDILLGKGAVEQPGDDGEVLALIEGRQDDRVHILAGSLGGSHAD